MICKHLQALKALILQVFCKKFSEFIFTRVHFPPKVRKHRTFGDDEEKLEKITDFAHISSKERSLCLRATPDFYFFVDFSIIYLILSKFLIFVPVFLYYIFR